MTLTVCAQDGCPELVPSGYCPTHHKPRPRTPDHRPNAHQRGYDMRWARTRARYLATHRQCARCPAPATQVHHRDGKGPKGPRGHDPHNLEAMCHRCHSRVTATMQPGGFNMRSPDIPAWGGTPPARAPNRQLLAVRARRSASIRGGA